MDNKKLIAEALTGDMELFTDPSTGFLNYQFSKMYSFYRNYLDYSSTLLLELSDFTGYAIEIDLFGLQEVTKKEIQAFADEIDAFYEKHKESDDFTLLQDPYWKTFIKKAQKTLVAFKEDLKENGILSK